MQQREDLAAYNAARLRERQAELEREEAERRRGQRMDRIAHALLIIITLVSIGAGIWLVVKS